MYKPLADDIRPSSLDDVVGQKHILGENGMLRRIIESGKSPNLIFYGPSGTGKTTVASIIAGSSKRALYKLNATQAGTADIKEIIDSVDTLMAPDGVLLYLDEIQYFNKKQQQSLLEYIENGKISLIASTTENPYFYIYGAILSRCTVFEFKAVEPEELRPAVIRAFDILGERTGLEAEADEEVIKRICFGCGGDVRKAINTAEMLFYAGKNDGVKVHISEDDADMLSQKSSMHYDRDGDGHYDILSAFQKSIRGSDPDAGLHYLARLLEAGDIISACRRLLVIAAEDIGLAYPQAIPIVKACVDSALQLGLPEARIPLADAVILLATAPKSNSGVVAIDKAAADIRKGKTGDIPRHLKNVHADGADAGAIESYKYAHSYENHWVEQQYLPDVLKDTRYYEYGDNKTEQAARTYWSRIKK
ncbi:MAG: replication-associated recombination protein A [Oscillospiraceae bacterium]|jgi:putative ATPase|nr:replication-associated recombination protein A [Oscillospiraceae bacterium]